MNTIIHKPETNPAQLDLTPTCDDSKLGRAVALLIQWGKERRARLAAEEAAQVPTSEQAGPIS